MIKVMKINMLDDLSKSKSNSSTTKSICLGGIFVTFFILHALTENIFAFIAKSYDLLL